MIKRPSWMMSRDQAETIKRTAIEFELTKEEFVDRVLDNIVTTRPKTCLRRKVLEQLEWLLDGRSEEDPPYLEEYYETGCDPFSVPTGCEDELDDSIERFMVNGFITFRCPGLEIVRFPWPDDLLI